MNTIQFVSFRRLRDRGKWGRNIHTGKEFRFDWKIQLEINAIVQGHFAFPICPQRIYIGCVIVTLLKPLFNERGGAPPWMNFHDAAFSAGEKL